MKNSLKYLLVISLLFHFVVKDSFLTIKANYDQSLLTVNRKQIEAGFKSSYEIDAYGNLYGWGSGVLGDGQSGVRQTPVLIMSDVQKVSSRYYHTLALKTDGSLWAWGENESGQVGNDTFDTQFLPVNVLNNVVDVATGADHSLAITSDGSLWAWGMNDAGQLGNGNEDLRYSLVPIKVLDNAKSIVADLKRSLAIMNDDSVWQWGYLTKIAELENKGLKKEDSFYPIKILEQVDKIEINSDSGFAVKNDGSLWRWGSNNCGGYEADPEGYSTFFIVEPLKIMDDVKDVSVGDDFHVILKNDGTAWTKGIGNDFGQLGTNRVGWFGDGKYFVLNITTCEYVNVLSNVEMISASFYNALALLKSGEVYGWGNNYLAQLGLGPNNYIYRDEPGKYQLMEDVKSVSVSGGDSKMYGWSQTSLIIKTDDSLWAWGDNRYGAVGNNTRISVMQPVKIMDNIVKAQTGAAHSAALNESGTLFTWGGNGFGELGDGKGGNNYTWADQYVPLAVMNDVKDFETHSSFMMAIKKDNTLWGWGFNGYGEIGIGEVDNNITSPRKIMADVKQIDVGGNFAIALKNDGSVWTWGRNTDGQLGNGTNANSSIPIKVMSNVKSVYTGSFTSFAVSEANELWAWGDNSYAQIGNGDTLDQWTPVKILDGVKRVFSNGKITIVEMIDGRTMGWGENNNNILGNDNGALVLSPRFIDVGNYIDIYNAALIEGYRSNDIYLIDSMNMLWVKGNIATIRNFPEETPAFSPQLIHTKDFIESVLNLDVKFIDLSKSNQLIWNEMDDVSGYDIYVSNYFYEDFKYLDSTSQNTYSHNNLDSNRLYTYKIRPFRIENGIKMHGLFSGGVSVITPANAPVLNAVSNKANSISLNWKGIYYAKAYTIMQDGTEISSNIDPYVTNFEIDNLEGGRKYDFEIILHMDNYSVTSDLVTVIAMRDPQVAVPEFVTRFYELVLNRTTDPWGLNDWTTKLLNGERNGADVAYGFVFSDEFKDRAVSDEQYVNIMYEAFFNRSADAGGYANWMDALSKGMSRYYVLRGFTDSQEFKDLASSYGINPGSLVLSQPADLYPDITAFVTRFYKETLNRMPDEGGLNDWVNQLQKKSRTGADVAYGFIFSDEFKAKNLSNDLFVKTLYSAFFGREADEGGYNDWMNRLASGQTREQVLKGFLGSAEFRDLCTKYGINPGI